MTSHPKVVAGGAFFGKGPGGNKYRYDLYRNFVSNPVNQVGFILLNPSTADGIQDDPTIRRCINYALDWGFEAMHVINLFAYRATNPAELYDQLDPIGPENNDWIECVAENCTLLVAGWGAFGGFKERNREVLKLLKSRNGQEVYHLGTTKKGGHPRHPLYLKKDLVPTLFEWK